MVFHTNRCNFEIFKTVTKVIFMFLMNFVTSEYTVKAVLFSQFFIYFHYIGH